MKILQLHSPHGAGCEKRSGAQDVLEGKRA